MMHKFILMHLIFSLIFLEVFRMFDTKNFLYRLNVHVHPLFLIPLVLSQWSLLEKGTLQIFKATL